MGSPRSLSLVKRSGRLSLPLKVTLTPGGLRETSRPPRPLRASLSLSAREGSLLRRSSRGLAKTSTMSL
jgi:hypothetical protein